MSLLNILTNQQFQALFLWQEGKQKPGAPFSFLACFRCLMQWLIICIRVFSLNWEKDLPACRQWMEHIRTCPAHLQPTRGWPLKTPTPADHHQHDLSVHLSEELLPPPAKETVFNLLRMTVWCLAHFKARVDCYGYLTLWILPSSPDGQTRKSCFKMIISY